MKRLSRPPTLGLITAMVIAVGFALTSEPRAQGPDPEIAAIQGVLDRQEVAWNKGDLDAFLDGYWHAPGLVFQSGGDRNDGFEATRDRYRKRYKAEGKAMGRVTFSNVQIQILAPDAGFVRGAWKLDLPDGKKPGGLYTLIFRKFADGWKIVHDHTSVADDSAVPPAPPAPTPVPPARAPR